MIICQFACNLPIRIFQFISGIHPIICLLNQLINILLAKHFPSDDSPYLDQEISKSVYCIGSEMGAAHYAGSDAHSRGIVSTPMALLNR
jgi:hypothetical protein